MYLNIRYAGTEPTTSQQQLKVDFSTHPALRLVPATTSEGKKLYSAVEKAFLVGYPRLSSVLAVTSVQLCSLVQFSTSC